MPQPIPLKALPVWFFTLLLSALFLLAPTTATAREMVSVKGTLVNMRSGPGTGCRVTWQLEKGYPLQVLAKKGSWLKVRDFENDRGWISRSVIGRTPHYIVKVPVATTLAIDEPLMMPVAADDTTAALAGPPRMWPSRANALLMK